MVSRNVFLVTGASTVRGLGYSSIWIYSALYMHEILKISFFYDGIIFTAGGLLAAFVNIYGGAISDKVGYKETMIFSFSMAIVIYGAISFVPGIALSNILYPAAFMMFMVANAIMSPASNALISRSSHIQLKGFSILRVGNNIGWGFGPAIGGFIESFSGYHMLFVFGFLMGIIALGISLFLINVRDDGKKARAPLNTSNTWLIQLSVIALLLFIVQAQETVTLANYATIFRSLKVYDLGFVYLTNGIFVTVSQGFIYKITRRIGNYTSFAIGSFIYSFGFFSYAFDTGLFGMILSTIVLTIGEDFAFPVGYSMVSAVSKPENIGKNIGIYNAFLSIGRAVGPTLGGVAFTLFPNPYELWFFTTLTGFISCVLFIVRFRKVDSLRYA